MKLFRKLAAVVSSAGLLISVAAMPVAAASNVSVDFETYTLGTIDGQDGWTSTGANGSGCAVYDHEVDDSGGNTNFGNQSLRISNAVTSGCFGDQTFSKPLTDAVGETGAGAGTYSVGTLQPYFETSFDIASTVPESQQPGLFMSVSPDRGDGSRMSYLGFGDVADGIEITFFDVQGTSNPANFVPTVLGTFSRNEVHNIKLTLHTVDGASNDVVNVYVDGVLEHTGTSWENYYRFDSEASAEQNVRAVRTVLFRTGGAAAPATDGNGFLVDNLNLSSGQYPVSGEITNPTADGEHVSGLVNLTATYDDGDSVNDDAVQWAVRQGTCDAGTGTVFGNVDGHSDVASWDGQNFSYNLDTSGLVVGDTYCFVFNPTDDAGQTNIRLTRTFIVDEAPNSPTAMDECKKGGWLGFGFRNQGQCVRFVQTGQDSRE